MDIAQYDQNRLRWAFLGLILAAAIAGLAMLGGRFLCDRAVMAAGPYTVDSLDDAVDASVGDGVCQTATGECTLRAAIQEANASSVADTINITATGTITLTGDLPTITEALTIEGPGAANLTVDGADSYTHFAVDVGVTAEISDLTLTDGAATHVLWGDNHCGGAIYNAGTLTLNDVTITGSSASGSSYGVGGGIYTAFGSVTVINGGQIGAQDAPNAADMGGGIYNSGAFTLTAAVSYNTAVTGGGIYNYRGMVIQDSTIAGNTADVGGGIHNNPNRQLTIMNSAVVSNTAGEGGGIYNRGALTATLSTVSDNRANNGDGGGIYNNYGSAIIAGTVSQNVASDDGGGFYNYGGVVSIQDSTLFDNQATEGGGGICNDEDGGVILANSIVISNTGTNGGGIYNSQTLTLTNSTVVSNTASNDGGGIHNEQGTLKLTDSAIIDNTSADDGGGVYSDGSSGGATLTVDSSTIGGNRADGGGGVYLYYSPASLTNTTLSGNQALSSGGGVGTLSDLLRTVDLLNCTIYTNTCGQNGGGAQLEPNFTVNVKNTIVAGNSASGTGPDVEGTVNSQDHNLIQDTSGATINGTTTHNVTGQTPVLGPLAANGGPSTGAGGAMLTHALLPGSPAIDAGTCDGAPPTDQRGVARPQGEACDIGAYEAKLVDLRLTKTVDDDTPRPGQRIVYTVAIDNSGLLTATDLLVTDPLSAGLTFAGPITIDPPGAGTIGTPPTLASGVAITAGTSITITVPVTVNTGLDDGTIITNTAAVAGTAVMPTQTDSAPITVTYNHVYLPLVLRDSMGQ
jgi:uncharacterized repeat protein (TIGR01451 family)/CSLREA domain-containing protein